MASAPPPPPPPPHGTSGKSSPLPNGNYDIFIIPPHSAGSGFLYLPSLKPNINSFIAGFCTCLLAVGIWNILVPAVSQTIASLNSGIGVLLCLAAIAAAFSIGRTAGDATFPSSTGHNSGGPGFASPRSAPPPHTSPPRSKNTAQSSWEQAKEQTRQRAEERRKADELRNQQDAAERAAKAATEKDRWEQQRAREKDARERAARERIAKERAEREATKAGAGARKYEKPSAQSVRTESEYFTQHQAQQQPPPFSASVGSSVSEQSETDYAPSMSTARTTPPPSGDREPYKTADPNKVVLLGVYTFTAAFGMKPTSMLERNKGGVTDGLVLRMSTEGLFIDDDVRVVAQREWDVKAWNLKLLEIGRVDNTCVCRASLRDVEGKKYVFVLPSEQQWKLDAGLQRLRKGSQVRALGLSTMPDKELKQLLMSLGWK